MLGLGGSAGSSSPYQLVGLLFAKPYLGCCSLLWELVERESRPGLPQLEDPSLWMSPCSTAGCSQGSWSIPWQMDPVPPAHPEEEAAEMKRPHSNGTLGLETV